MVSKKNLQVSILCEIVLILQNVAIFFSDIVHYITLINIICLVLYLVYMILNKVNLRFIKAMKIWGIYLILVSLNLIIGGDGNFIISFLLINLVMFLELSIGGMGLLEYKIIRIFSECHLLTSLIVYFLPHSIYDGLFAIILGKNAMANYSWRVISNMNAGITTQPGINAMYLSLLIMICAVEIIEKKRKIIFNILLFLCSFLMLVTTGKRSAVVITILIIILYFCSIHLKEIKKITFNSIVNSMILVSLFVIFGYWLINNSNEIQTILIKTQKLSEMGDISNGRFEIWDYALKKWYEHPILGIGFKQIQSERGIDVHNTYIQILAETGIIGFSVFIVALIRILMYSYKSVKANLTNCSVDTKCSIGFGFMLICFLTIYGFVGNTFIDYLPIMLFTVAILMNMNGMEKIG